ncbi:MAG: hypothetical protein AB7T10_00055 [bacterium]
MKRLFLILISAVFFISAESDLIVYGFSDDASHFAFAYEPKDPTVQSGGLKILSIKENSLTADTLLNEFEDSYSSLKDVSDFFNFHFREVLGFNGETLCKEFSGNAQDGVIDILGINTGKITYSINKSVNDFGYYDYTTTVRVEDRPPVMFDSKLTDIYGAYMADDSLCVIITKGIVTGFEGTFSEDFNIFSVNAKSENLSDSFLKERMLELNIKKVRRIMDDFFSEHHEIYPDNVDLLNRYGKVIENPINEKNEQIVFCGKLPKFISKYEGAIFITVGDARQSYKIFYGGKNEFIEAKEKEK